MLNVIQVMLNIFFTNIKTEQFQSQYSEIHLGYHFLKSLQILSFFCSVFSQTRTEYGDLLRKSLYSVQGRENTDQKILRISTLFTQ